jgi:hypothetical protein
MFHSVASSGSSGDAAALEIQVERAGTALACAFWSSAEFEAALIAARRAAGVYGPRRYRRRVFAASCAFVALMTIGLLIF